MSDAEVEANADTGFDAGQQSGADQLWKREPFDNPGSLAQIAYGGRAKLRVNVQREVVQHERHVRG